MEKDAEGAKTLIPWKKRVYAARVPDERPLSTWQTDRTFYSRAGVVVPDTVPYILDPMIPTTNLVMPSGRADYTFPSAKTLTPAICTICKDPLIGIYYRCLDCPKEVLLCAPCEQFQVSAVHNANHVLAKIRPNVNQ